MNILVLIPARMGSSRFPGKPLVKIFEKPMIGHIYENISRGNHFTSVAVATCDKEIDSYIKSIGGRSIMTSKKHDRASDRCAEALLKIEEEDNIVFDIVVMAQGDEPMTNSQMIIEAVQPLKDNKNIKVVNLLGEIKSKDEFEDVNCVKVVHDIDFNALYFSREPIPSRYLSKQIPMGKQICIIPFNREFLIKYNNLSQTPLEIAESIDMNRVLEHGYNVKMVPTRHISYPVDTKKDLERVRKIMKNH